MDAYCIYLVLFVVLKMTLTKAIEAARNNALIKNPYSEWAIGQNAGVESMHRNLLAALPDTQECPDIKPEIDFMAHLDDQWNWMAEKYPEDYYRYCSVFHQQVKKLLLRNTVSEPPKDKP